MPQFKVGRDSRVLSKVSRLRDLADSMSAHARRSRPWRVLSLSVRNFLRNNDPLWASALTYTTTLSIVPVLALALSTVSALHQGPVLYELIKRYLAAGSPEIADRILGFVSKADNRALSAFGAGALLVTAIMTLKAVEQAFDNIFRASQTRSPWRKFTDYLGIIFAVPPIIAAAVGLREGIAAFLPDWLVLRWALSSAMVWWAIWFLYLFFPNARVRWSSALLGALAAALLLDLAQSAFVHFQYGVSRYRAIYGALAAVPIFMTWNYISWTILLCGAELAAALQSADDELFDAEPAPQDFARAAALLTILRLAQRMKTPRARVDADTIAGELGVAKQMLAPLLGRLKESGLTVEAQEAASDSRPQGLFLARDPELISLAEVMGCARAASHVRVRDPKVQNVIRLLGQSEDEVMRALTVRDLLGEGNEIKRLLEEGAPATPHAIAAKSR